MEIGYKVKEIDIPVKTPIAIVQLTDIGGCEGMGRREKHSFLWYLLL